MLLAQLRRLGERAAALLATGWKTLTNITLTPRIGSITKAALVFAQLEYDGRY